ncbi:LAGLIDADG family homing endonuclease [Priestia megaterium]|uniref:LAGLIDADG family homing endonuclease n=1 Tax=Priestia megaterium TaxID=1404 RepID=UPI0012B8F93F|nr:LAGLIDADG family homing endonuclease [Priestia megaterium]
MPYPRILRDKLNKKDLHKLYWEEKMTIKQIAEKYNVNFASVQKYMKDIGVPRRDKYASKWLNSPVQVNETFFSEWSKQMAYVLGIIVTDGSIEKKTGSLRISMTDFDVIEKIASAMDLENGVSLVKKRGNNKQQYKLAVCRRSFVEDFIRLGIKINGEKTYKQGKVEVPRKFRNHFIRGVFDGDGSLVIRHRVSPKGTPYISHDLTIVSASKDFLQSIVEIINDDIDINICVKKYKGGTKGKYKDLYRINFSDRVKIAKFLNYIYEDKGTLFMERKYNKYIKEGPHLLNIDLF